MLGVLGLVCTLAAVAPPEAATPLAALSKAFEYAASKPLDSKLTLLYERNGVKTYDLVYASPRGGMVTGFLVAPAGPGPFAGVVFGHWGPGDRTQFLPEAVLYAESGAVSVLIDYPWVRPEPWRRKQGSGLKEGEKDAESWVHAVTDLQRAIDLLQARPDVDRTRIGYVGHSYGAQWGAILSAIDDRVRAAVLMGGVGSSTGMLAESPEPDLVEMRKQYSREQLAEYVRLNRPFDAILYVPHAAPTPLLFQFGRHERIMDEASMKSFAAAASEPRQVQWYDTGHDLNDPQALTDRAAWLGPKIGLKPVRLPLEKRLQPRASPVP